MRIDLTTQVQNILPVANGGTGTSNGAILPNFADNETPSGVVNGSNAVFTLANIPNPSGSLQQFVEPLGQKASLYLQGVDYTLVASTVTFGVAPASGSLLRAWYRWNVHPATEVVRDQLFLSDNLNFILAQFQLPVQFSDSLSLTDNFNIYLLPLHFAFSDSLLLSDNFAYVNRLVLLQLNQPATDQLTMSDTIAFTLRGGAEVMWLNDTMAVMNDRITRFGYGVGPSEYMQLTDAFTITLV